MSTPDRSAEVAAFLRDGGQGLAPQAILLAIGKRWPDLTKGEFDRAFRIAFEVIEADVAENTATAAALTAERDWRFGNDGGAQ